MHDIKHSHHDGCFTEEEHQILLSGSVMVQTATGKIFTSQDDRCDVDVFVCRHNAAKLRKALTEHGFVCSNLFAPYTPRQALHMFELQGINHVEQYIIKDDTIATITADERLNRELQGFQEDEDFLIHPDGAILDDLLRSGEMPHGFLFVTHPGTLPVWMLLFQTKIALHNKSSTRLILPLAKALTTEMNSTFPTLPARL
eukprot:scaffold58_cov79-Skeletonema_marinoi.AAC.17